MVVTKNNDRIIVVFLIIVCFSIHFLTAIHAGSLSPDGTQYISIGKNIAESGKYQSNGSHFPDIIQPPFYPLCIAILYLIIGDAFISGFLATSLFKALCIVPLFLLGRMLFDKSVAIITSILFIFYPLLFSNSCKILTEPVYCFFLLWVVYLIFIFLKEKSYHTSISIGIMIGVAYSTRVEGILLLFIFFSFTAIECITSKNIWINLKYFLSCLMGFLIIYIPLSGFIYLHSGQWMPSPKIKLILTHQKMWRSSAIEPSFRTAPGHLKSQMNRFKYSSEIHGLMANKLFFDIKPDKTIRNPQLHNKSTFKFARETIAEQISSRLSTYFRNLFHVYKTLNYHWVVPPLLLLLLPIGFFGQPWAKYTWIVNIRLLIILFFLSLFLFSHFEYRFLFPVITLGLFWWAKGIIHFIQWISMSLNAINICLSERFLKTLVVLIIVLSMLPSLIIIMNINKIKMERDLDIAELIKKYVPENTTVIDRTPESSYLADKKYATLPYVDYQGLLHYSLRFPKAVLVFRKEDKPERPELAKQLEDYRKQKKYNMIYSKDCFIIFL